MVITINKHDFIQAFKDAGRENQFSLDALTVLFHPPRRVGITDE